MPANEEKTKQIYKWGCITIIIIMLVVASICLPFLVLNKSTKILLFILIGIVLLLLIIIIIIMEWIRRKSHRRREATEDAWVSQNLQVRTLRDDEPAQASDIGTSSRISWIHWAPKKKTRASAPPMETDIQ